MSRFRTALALAAVVALAVAGGCSSDDDDSTDDPTTTTSTPSEGATEDTAAVDVVVDDEVTVVGSALGDVLTLGGWPIYAFDRDTPETSTCTDQCAAAWPPVPADTPVPEDLGLTTGSVSRDDGSEQLTINGAPVYTFATDEPLPADGDGEPVGQGANDVWWVLAADGNPIRDIPSN